MPIADYPLPTVDYFGGEILSFISWRLLVKSHYHSLSTQLAQKQVSEFFTLFKSRNQPEINRFQKNNTKWCRIFRQLKKAINTLKTNNCKNFKNSDLTISFDVVVNVSAVVGDTIANLATVSAYRPGEITPALAQDSNTVTDEVIPEPATFVLLGIGLFGVLALRQRRWKSMT